MKPFWRSYLAGFAVPFAAFGLGLMSGMTPVLGTFLGLLLAAGAVAVGKSFAGVAAGIATVLVLTGGTLLALFAAIANSGFG